MERARADLFWAGIETEVLLIFLCLCGGSAAARGDIRFLGYLFCSCEPKLRNTVDFITSGANVHKVSVGFVRHICLLTMRSSQNPAARRGITANKVKAACSLVILNTFIVKQRHRKRCVFSRSNWTRLLNQQKNTADVLKLNRFRQKLPKYWEAAPVQTRCWRSESLRLDLTQHNQMCKNSFKIQTFNTNVWYKLK